MNETRRKTPLFRLFNKKYYDKECFITFNGLKQFLKDIFCEDFKPNFLPVNDSTDLDQIITLVVRI